MLKHKQYLEFLEMVSSAKRIQDIWDVLRNSIDYESTQALGIQYVTVQRVIHQILWDIVGVFRYCGIQVLCDSDIVGFRYCGRLDLRFSSHAFTCQCNEGANATS